jgi:hypothetical protein
MISRRNSSLPGTGRISVFVSFQPVALPSLGSRPLIVVLANGVRWQRPNRRRCRLILKFLIIGDLRNRRKIVGNRCTKTEMRPGNLSLTPKPSQNCFFTMKGKKLTKDLENQLFLRALRVLRGETPSQNDIKITAALAYGGSGPKCAACEA